MENGSFIDGLPSYKMMIFHGKLLVITRWSSFFILVAARDSPPFFWILNSSPIFSQYMKGRTKRHPPTHQKKKPFPGGFVSQPQRALSEFQTKFPIASHICSLSRWASRTREALGSTAQKAAIQQSNFSKTIEKLRKFGEKHRTKILETCF